MEKLTENNLKNILKFSSIIVIGFGKIATECVKYIKDNFNSDIIFINYEKEFFFNFKFDSRIKLLEFSKKEDLTSFFKKIKNNCLIISANNNYIFPQEIIGKNNLKIINFHNSLLPLYKGRNAQTWVIFKQEKTTGISWHLVNKNIDDGNLLYQANCPISVNETALSLTKKLMNLGIESFKILFPRIISEPHVPNLTKMQSQINKSSSTKTYFSREIPENGILNISWDINKISAFLRSLDYGIIKIFPKPKTKIEDKFVTIKNYKIHYKKTSMRRKLIFTKNKIEISEKNIMIALYI